MPVELSIVESVTSLETTVVEVVLESASEPGPAGPGVLPGGTTGQALLKSSNTDFDTEWGDVGGAPSTADYLVGTAQAGLAAEIVVGATPGGELGGTWASPTVDATHSGSSHASVQSAAEATAAAALAAHEADTTSIHGIANTANLETTAGAQAKVDTHVNDASDAHDASAISFTPAGTIAATDVQAAIEEVATEAGGGGAPTDVDYLVGTASGGLSAEIVVGATPGGELGGTWASPTVDATHSGSSHAGVQAAAEATAAAALDAHVTDASAAHAASAISADSTTLVGTGTDVQAVLEELDNGIADHLADTSAAHAASAVSFSPTGSIAATDVQAAIAEAASEASGIPVDGWISAGETWTYASADDPTYTLTISGDLTTKYSVGMRVRVSQSTGGTKYFIITKVAYGAPNTTLTLYGGTDYDLANETISSPYYSPLKAPFGFPLDPTKWMASLADSTDQTQASPTGGTWYNVGTFSLSVPIGAWHLSWRASLYMTKTTAATRSVYGTLSTANNTESDDSMTAGAYAGNVLEIMGAGVGREQIVVLTSKTVYYLNAKTDVASAGSLSILGTTAATRIRALCAYL